MEDIPATATTTTTSVTSSSSSSLSDEERQIQIRMLQHEIKDYQYQIKSLNSRVALAKLRLNQLTTTTTTTTTTTVTEQPQPQQQEPEDGEQEEKDDDDDDIESKHATTTTTTTTKPSKPTKNKNKKNNKKEFDIGEFKTADSFGGKQPPGFTSITAVYHYERDEVYVNGIDASEGYRASDTYEQKFYYRTNATNGISYQHLINMVRTRPLLEHPIRSQSKNFVIVKRTNTGAGRYVIDSPPVDAKYTLYNVTPGCIYDIWPYTLESNALRPLVITAIVDCHQHLVTPVGCVSPLICISKPFVKKAIDESKEEGFGYFTYVLSIFNLSRDQGYRFRAKPDLKFSKQNSQVIFAMDGANQTNYNSLNSNNLPWYPVPDADADENGMEIVDLPKNFFISSAKSKSKKKKDNKEKKETKKRKKQSQDDDDDDDDDEKPRARKRQKKKPSKDDDDDEEDEKEEDEQDDERDISGDIEDVPQRRRGNGDYLVPYTEDGEIEPAVVDSAPTPTGKYCNSVKVVVMYVDNISEMTDYPSLRSSDGVGKDEFAFKQGARIEHLEALVQRKIRQEHYNATAYSLGMSVRVVPATPAQASHYDCTNPENTTLNNGDIWHIYYFQITDPHHHHIITPMITRIFNVKGLVDWTVVDLTNNTLESISSMFTANLHRHEQFDHDSPILFTIHHRGVTQALSNRGYTGHVRWYENEQVIFHEPVLLLALPKLSTGPINNHIRNAVIEQNARYEKLKADIASLVTTNPTNYRMEEEEEKEDTQQQQQQQRQQEEEEEEEEDESGL